MQCGYFYVLLSWEEEWWILSPEVVSDLDLSVETCQSGFVASVRRNLPLVCFSALRAVCLTDGDAQRDLKRLLISTQCLSGHSWLSSPAGGGKKWERKSAKTCSPPPVCGVLCCWVCPLMAAEDKRCSCFLYCVCMMHRWWHVYIHGWRPACSQSESQILEEKVLSRDDVISPHSKTELQHSAKQLKQLETWFKTENSK